MNSSLVLEIPVMIAVMVLLTAPAFVKGKLPPCAGCGAAGNLCSVLRDSVYALILICCFAGVTTMR